MFYVEKDNKIVLFDKNREKIQNTLLFMPEYTGLKIKETNRPIANFQFTDTEEYEQELMQKERERIQSLSMTRGDMFEALILAKGLGKTQLRAMIEAYETDATTKLLYLNRFDEALDFYRGYPIFDLLGEQIGITPEMWDRFFDETDKKNLEAYKELLAPILETENADNPVITEDLPNSDNG